MRRAIVAVGIVMSMVSVRAAWAGRYRRWPGAVVPPLSISPAPGTTLPPDPTIVLLAPDDHLPALTVTDDGEAARFTVDSLGLRPAGEHVWAVHVSAPRGRVAIAVDVADTTPALFSIDPDRTARAHAMSLDRRVDAEQRDVIDVSADDVEAVRFRCEGPPSSFADGEPPVKVDVPYEVGFPTRGLPASVARAPGMRWAADLLLRNGGAGVRCRIEAFANDGTMSSIERDFTQKPHSEPALVLPAPVVASPPSRRRWLFAIALVIALITIIGAIRRKRDREPVSVP
jgi:hypothetical protein